MRTTPRALLSVVKAVRIVAQRALAEAGILHRDISFGNILIRTRAQHDPIRDAINMEEVPEGDARDSNTTEDCDNAAFLTDFEFASLSEEETELMREQVARPTLESSVSQVNVHDVFDQVPRKASVRQPGDERTVRAGSYYRATEQSSTLKCTGHAAVPRNCSADSNRE
ncbi:hypothetical protein C8Q73DRAFT_118900 [Cubamyces lactineus]|nr:hypothetical protein C8Q73DRAFT_118900 [Cubamyces lactineus]